VPIDLMYRRDPSSVRSILKSLPSWFGDPNAIDNVALVFLVQSPLGGSATTFGLVQACFGVGMLAVSIALGTRRSASAPPLLLAGAGATAVGSLLTAFAPSLLAAGGAQTVAGAGNAMVNVAPPPTSSSSFPRRCLGACSALWAPPLKSAAAWPTPPAPHWSQVSDPETPSLSPPPVRPWASSSCSPGCAPASAHFAPSHRHELRLLTHGHIPALRMLRPS